MHHGLAVAVLVRLPTKGIVMALQSRDTRVSHLVGRNEGYKAIVVVVGREIGRQRRSVDQMELGSGSGGRVE